MPTPIDPPHPGPPAGYRRPAAGRPLLAIVVAWGAFTAAGPALAADADEAAKLLRRGDYAGCARQAAEAIRDGERDEAWPALKIRAEMAQGKYDEALKSLKAATRRYPASLNLYLLGRDVRRFNGLAGGEPEAMKDIEEQVQSFPRRYATAEGQVALGRFLLLRGADPKKVLDQFYDSVIRQVPDFLDAYMASAELALDKQDHALAAETLRKAPKEAAEDPRYHYLMALAFADDDRAAAAKSLQEALKINPRYVDALLLTADALVDSEKYADAAKVLDSVSAINPSEPRAWVYRAVLAHLRSDEAAEASARKSALAPWPANPEVDALIGRKLAQKYRFAEAATYLRRALAFDAGYMPARVQLAETLLRLGEEAEGWKLAGEVFAADGYNVVAYNLMTLHDLLAKFRTLEEDGLVVRMDPREADLYGPRVLALLKRARSTLAAKYGATLPSRVIVEIFPRKKEFAVRTFGLPGADGFLGVCFGPVITANSPASQGESPSNWESVLWHEFCHSVTLSKTRNKMPRWLSEGISVYEEGQQDPAWKTVLNPRFREMILGDDLTPLSQLSSAFLAPKSAQHIQFAYFESALAVEFLVKSAGLDGLKGVLDDLGAGRTINDSLPARTRMSLSELDGAFARFARERAEATARGLTWEDVDVADDASSRDVEAWLKSHPTSFKGRQLLATRLIAEKRWPEAKAALTELKERYPEYVGPENPYMLLAAIDRQASDPAAEHAVLDELAARDGDASAAYIRLMELDEAAGNWDGVARNANRLLAVNPLVPAPHRSLARAVEHLGRRDDAIAAWKALALLDDTDPAQTHFRLAKLLGEAGRKDEARREVLKSLEEAPRFLDAHRLLLDLVDNDHAGTTPRPPSGSSHGH
ncbi:tetratricopeptide repeat protein [Aquisphaera giovannonii]|uniref:Tetratricopeptide repeat protein n=1 Tax=Aquisphaera giovannonii TaxID=406548 RepID=A0A5B9W744_9BACT|nr:tetratricopeptide repeat protein [Aquisphaera giovannonii]QEH36398.1 tetratricopeptide repeat protein [Aquisphaera giovannonii]